MENALVSIILPVYNAENQLRTCMESVLCQTYSNLEFIVIDDGSTDQSVAVARSFHDARLTVIEAEHKGVSHARNIGLEKMTGQYFTFVDADDFVADTYVEVMLSDLRRYDADIAFTRIEFHYQNEGFVYKDTVDEKCCLADGKQVVEACFDLDENLRGYNAGVCGRMFRSSFYQKGREQFDETFSYGEDAKWLFPLVMRAARVVLDEKTLYHYNRIRGKYTNYQANIYYYSWRLSFYREYGLPERMICSTENLLYANQFSYLMKEYENIERMENRVQLVERFPELWKWLVKGKPSWGLGQVKRIVCYLMMRLGLPVKTVMQVWKLHRL